MMKWDTTLYDDKHAFVTQYGAGVLELLAPQPNEQILDVGCGTGHLTQMIALAGAIPTGLDSSAEMIATARSAYPDLKFVQADVADFVIDHTFDAIFSNAALHWVHRAEEAVVCMSRALRPGGRFVVEFGGKGNVQQIYSTLEQALEEIAGIPVSLANYFPSLAEYSTLLERHGIEVTQAMLFERPTRLEAGEAGLENWIRMFRGQAFATLSDAVQRDVIDRVQQRLRNSLFHDDAWYADYRRLRIVGRKV